MTLRPVAFALLLGWALGGCAVVEAEAPNPDFFTAFGVTSGGLIGQSYDGRLATEVAAASARCVDDVGAALETREHELCVFTLLGTPQSQLSNYTVPDDGRPQPIVWLDRQRAKFMAYRARFVSGEEGLVERMVRTADFLERQKVILARRAEMEPVVPQTDY